MGCNGHERATSLKDIMIENVETPPTSKKEIINEILFCGKDPIYFIKKYGRVRHPIKGLIPLVEHDYQYDIVNALTKHRFNIILKARQLGVSTIIGLYIVWFMMFHKDKNILVIASKQETAVTMIRIVKAALRSLPKWMSLSKIAVDNVLSVELSNGSRVKALASSYDAGRSEAVSLLVVDECVAAGTKIKVRSKISGEIREINIEDLYKDEYR